MNELHYSISMVGVFRVLFIWLLAVTIPLKAIAMGSLIGCGPTHHGAPAMERSELSPHMHEHGGSRDSHQLHPVAGTGGMDDEDRGGSVDVQAAVKCGTCAPCCTAAAPAVECLVTTVARLPGEDIPFASRHYPEVQADVPHRPPRA